MAVQLGSRGQPDFSQPIELLMDCHRRIEHFLGVLECVAQRCGGAALDDESRRALLAALDYFTHAAPKHTADEEESLLPRLRSMKDRDLAPVLAAAERIERDHAAAAALHEEVDRTARGWLERGSLNRRELATLRDALGALRDLYTRHITFEDERLFPAAAAALAPDVIVTIGREMADRRGIHASPRAESHTPRRP